MLTNPDLMRNIVNNNQDRKLSISNSPNKYKLESINNDKENINNKELNDKESEMIKNEMEKQIKK